jgi:aromatic-L-amino-acid decarboxylase
METTTAGAPRPHPLEPDEREMRELAAAALDRIVGHIATLARQPASDIAGGDAAARALVEGPPEAGSDLGALLDLLFDRAIPLSFNAAGPGYLGYIPGGGLFASAVADLIADSVNRYTGVYMAAPALVQLESNVISWFAGMLGLPPETRGWLTSGGSLAAWTALVTARRERLPEDFLRGIVYTSDQAHYATAKAAVLAGFPEGNVRSIEADDSQRLSLERLAAAVRADRAAGLTPFLVAANAGTTNTGAVDPLHELADLAAREGLWLHVDAAYGGFFSLTERGRRALAGIERADSVVLDPHKGLFLPFGTGALLVRDGQALRRAHELTGSFMPYFQQDPDRVDFCAYSPELSRPYRGLRVWLPLKLYGLQAFRDELDEKLDLARHAAAALGSLPDLEIVTRPELSLFSFRLHPRGIEGEDLDELNRRFLGLINDRKRAFITGTVLRGRFVLRVCVLSFRTHLDRIEMLIEDIAAARAELLES